MGSVEKSAVAEYWSLIGDATVTILVDTPMGAICVSITIFWYSCIDFLLQL